mmetsp:Transcript_31163/g.52347  ORF Transcript_31163/g.52347 Transcript_31163/m.52347 type:complete len:92 (-) Transcript_31163:104-379(-)
MVTVVTVAVDIVTRIEAETTAAAPLHHRVDETEIIRQTIRGTGGIMTLGGMIEMVMGGATVTMNTIGRGIMGGTAVEGRVVAVARKLLYVL